MDKQIRNAQLQSVIQKLRVMEIDGDTMEYILRQVGMEEQILKQLILSADGLCLKNALELRDELEQRDSIKDFWQECTNREFELKHRLACIYEDAENIMKEFSEILGTPNDNWDSLGTLVSNISIAADLKDNESLMWTSKSRI
jgi:hypothetical protein